MTGGAAKLAPSIPAADLARLGEQVAEAEKVGASRIHVDAMDGHFVPNLSMGAPIVQSLRRVTSLPLETHLMISNPDFFFEEFIKAGSDSFLVRWEGNNNLHRTVRRIKELGERAGSDQSRDIGRGAGGDPAGFGHQPFIRSTLPKIERVRRMIELEGLKCEVAVGGGVDEETAALAAAAGAGVFVAGSSIFANSAGVGVAMSRLRAGIAECMRASRT